MTDKFDEMAETLLPVAVFGSDETIMIARIEISKALRAQHKAGQEAMRERNEKLEAALEMIACDEKISLGHGDYDERPLDNIAMQKVARAALTEDKALGREIGFGAMMTTASAGWREVVAERGHPTGGEFVAGPCLATVQMALAKVRAALAALSEAKPAAQAEGE